MLDVQKEVLSAEKRIRPYIRETPLDFSIPLSKMLNCQVYLKCENLQFTHAFKIRGAFSKLLSLTPEQRQKGIVTASSGNHGAAVAFGLKTLNLKGKVFIPENTSPAKIANIRNYIEDVEFFGTDCMQTEMHALAYGHQHDQVYISPYNDPQVIGGQGTISIELRRQLKQIDAVFVPIGGGGLISGIAGYLKAVLPQIRIVGCLPENSPVMAECVKAGKIVELKTRPTLSDATAGNLEPGAITFEICQKLVDDFILVSEDEIKKAIIKLIKTEKHLVEGAAGVALAGLIKSATSFANKNVVIILSGGNISIETLKDILAWRLNF